VSFPIRFENIKRVNGWANIYLHAALKLYAWCPSRVLVFLREFLLGRKVPGWVHNSKAGVTLDQATFDAIRFLIRQKHDGPDFDLVLLDPPECDALLR
jgi:hypothetical protein